MGEEELKTVEELAILELAKSARVLQRQLKIMRPLTISWENNEKVREIIKSLEKEFNLYRL